MATTKAEYVKVGVFMTLAVSGAVVAAIIFGAGNFGREEFLMETYFEESVQGIDVGGPVKFRGIPIGKIKDISFVWPTYSAPDTEDGRRAMRYARIIFSVDPRCVDEDGEIAFGGFVQDQLRVSIRNQGVTGLRYLNIDYVEGANTLTLPVPWEPQYQYIPSDPGLTKTIADVTQNISEQLSRLNIEEMVKMIKETFKITNDEIRKAKMGDTAEKVNSLVTRLDAMSAEFQSQLEDGKIKEIISEVDGLVSSLSQSAKVLENALPKMLESVDGIADNIEGVTGESRLMISETLEQIRTASLKVNELLARLVERPSLLIKDVE